MPRSEGDSFRNAEGAAGGCPTEAVACVTRPRPLQGGPSKEEVGAALSSQPPVTRQGKPPRPTSPNPRRVRKGGGLFWKCPSMTLFFNTSLLIYHWSAIDSLEAGAVLTPEDETNKESLEGSGLPELVQESLYFSWPFFYACHLMVTRSKHLLVLTSVPSMVPEYSVN